MVVVNSKGVPPPNRKFLKIRCQEIEFGGIFGGFSCLSNISTINFILIHA